MGWPHRSARTASKYKWRRHCGSAPDLLCGGWRVWIAIVHVGELVVLCILFTVLSGISSTFLSTRVVCNCVYGEMISNLDNVQWAVDWTCFCTNFNWKARLLFICKRFLVMHHIPFRRWQLNLFGKGSLKHCMAKLFYRSSTQFQNNSRNASCPRKDQSLWTWGGEDEGAPSPSPSDRGLICAGQQVERAKGSPAFHFITPSIHSGGWIRLLQMDEQQTWHCKGWWRLCWRLQ